MKPKCCYYFDIVYHYRLPPHSVGCLSACELFETVVEIKTSPAVVAMGAPPHVQVEYSCLGGTTMCANRVFVAVVE